MNSINLHIYPSPMTHESRILKETKSIADANLADQIFLVGMWKNGLEEHEQIDAKRQIWRVRPCIGNQESPSIIKALRYLEWQLRIFWRFRAGSVKYISCSSLPVLPIGVLFKIFLKSKLVYDTQEWESDVAGAGYVRRLLLKLVEKSLIHFVDAVITVNDSITELYKREYDLQNVTSVRNIPYRLQEETFKQDNILKRKFGIGENEILYIFQGSFGPGRGISIILDVFSRVDCHRHIVFMGFGEWEEQIKEYEQAYPNIHFQEAVSPSEVSRYTRGADVGICLQENIGLNYFLSLPNKLFEYIINGLPVIVSDFPEMRRVVDKAGCGWKVAVDRDALLALVNNIALEDIATKGARALQYRKTIGWQHEEKILLQVYRQFDAKYKKTARKKAQA